MNIIHKGIAVLLGSAVTGEKRKLPDGFTLEAAMPLIKKQSLETLVFQGALNCGIPETDPTMMVLMQKYILHLLKSEKQMLAIGQLLAEFERNGIDYLPLKGCNMKALYPKPELRVMGDADILIRFDQYERIEPIMSDLGFTLSCILSYTHEWDRSDLHVELHRYLIAADDRQFHQYFADAWNRAVREIGHRYRLSPEDVFLFQFVHMTNHYQHSGIGSRHILDLYVFLMKNPDLDHAYLEAELEKLHLLTFYRNMLAVLKAWFEDAPANDITEYITDYIFSGGSWGTMENGFQADALRKSRKEEGISAGRRKALVQMIFPPAKEMELNYPILQKEHWLLPVVWVYRWFVVLLRRPERIRNRISVAVNTSDEKVLERQNGLRYVGLDPWQDGDGTRS